MGKRTTHPSRKGKTLGRSRGDPQWSDELGRMTSPKMIAAIRSNKKK